MSELVKYMSDRYYVDIQRARMSTQVTPLEDESFFWTDSGPVRIDEYWIAREAARRVAGAFLTALAKEFGIDSDVYERYRQLACKEAPDA